MSKLEILETQFVSLNDKELMHVEGGIAPLVIGGGLVAGAAAGYYANHP